MLCYRRSAAGFRSPLPHPAAVLSIPFLLKTPYSTYKQTDHIPRSMFIPQAPTSILRVTTSPLVGNAGLLNSRNVQLFAAREKQHTSTQNPASARKLPHSLHLESIR